MAGLRQWGLGGVPQGGPNHLEGTWRAPGAEIWEQMDTRDRGERGSSFLSPDTAPPSPTPSSMPKACQEGHITCCPLYPCSMGTLSHLGPPSGMLAALGLCQLHQHRVHG